MHTAATNPAFTLTLKRNCSISPSAALVLWVAMGAVSLSIALLFAFVGAWMVLPFAGLEVIGLGLAFFAFARHAADYEALAIRDGRLLVEVRDGTSTLRSEFNAAWVRLIERRSAHDCRLALVAHGAVVEVGRHLDPTRREALAARLSQELQYAARTSGWRPEYRTQG